MGGRCVLLLGVSVCATLYADDLTDRAKLSGTWEVADGPDAGATWALEQNGDSIRITQSHKDQQLSRVECNLGGSECQLKDGGRPAKISMWFNGAKLVEMETRGSEITKRSFAVTGDSMEIQTVSIVPDGKPQVTRLKRAKVAAAASHP